MRQGGPTWPTAARNMPKNTPKHAKTSQKGALQFFISKSCGTPCQGIVVQRDRYLPSKGSLQLIVPARRESGG
jgi:hypothetical protein